MCLLQKIINSIVLFYFGEIFDKIVYEQDMFLAEIPGLKQRNKFIFAFHDQSQILEHLKVVQILVNDQITYFLLINKGLPRLGPITVLINNLHTKPFHEICLFLNHFFFASKKDKEQHAKKAKEFQLVFKSHLRDKFCQKCLVPVVLQVFLQVVLRKYLIC